MPSSGRSDRETTGFRTLGIAGCGLIGASIGLRARELGLRVVGYDLSGAVLARASESGAIDAASPALVDLARSVDTLVLAAPLDAVLAQIRELSELAGDDRVRTRGGASFPTLIVDVASVKAPVAAAARALRGFVPTHPIAGSQRSGPGAARADLFAGRFWTVDPAFAPGSVAAASAFIEALGAVPLGIDSAEHDRIVARTSHLPQLLSVALGAVLAPEVDAPRTRALCGTGMASMLRLAESSWPLWRSILTENAAPVAQEVRALSAVLSEAAASLESGDLTPLAALFSTAAAAAARVRANDATPRDVRVNDSPPTEGELP